MPNPSLGDDYVELMNRNSGRKTTNNKPYRNPNVGDDYAALMNKRTQRKEVAQKADKKQNILFTTLDNVNRLQYGVANSIYQAVVNDDYKLAKNYWDGLSLKEKRSVGDTLKEVIQPESTFGKMAVGFAGFAGDVLTDPLTYVGVGLVNRAGKAIKAGTTADKFIKAGRSVGKAKDTKRALKVTHPSLKVTDKGVRPTIKTRIIPGSDRLVDPIARGLSKTGRVIREDLGPVSGAIDKLRPVVSTKMRPKGVDPVEWQKVLRARDVAKNIQNKIELDSIEKARQILKAFRDEGLDDDEIAKITNAIETNTKVDSKGAKLAIELSQGLSKQYEKVGETGKQVIQDQDVRYLPHVLDKKSKKFKSELGLGARKFTTKSLSDIRRTLLKYTDESGEEFVISTKTGKLFRDGKVIRTIRKKDLKEVLDSGENGPLSQASILDINRAIGEPIFSSKLPQLLAIQGLRTAKVVGGDELFKRVRKLGSKVPKGDMVETSAPELAGRYFHPEVAKHIDEVHQKLVNPEEVNDLIKVYDKVQTAWKSTATFWNFAFHTRNAISNLWQNSLAGVNDFRDYVMAIKIQNAVSSGSLDSLTKAERTLLKEYRSNGLEKVGHMSGDIAQSMDEQIMSAMDLVKKNKAKGVVQSINKIGGRAGALIEDNAKIAHFLAKRKEGMSAFDSAQSVKKHLFDYSDLTTAEREVFKRFIPFYTFSRKNIPVQLEKLVTNPSAQTKLIKAKNNVEVYVGEDKTGGILPPWLKNAAPIYVGKKNGNFRYIKMEGFLPVADINRLSEPVQEMMNMISPVIKAPFEQAVNQSFFFGEELDKRKKDLLWWRVPGRLDHMARLFRPLNEIDKIIGRKYTGKSWGSKIANLALGGKVYEYSKKELLDQFDRLTEEEASSLKREINTLRRGIQREPAKRKQNMKDIKTNLELLKKAKRKARSAKRRARESF